MNRYLGQGLIGLLFDRISNRHVRDAAAGALQQRVRRYHVALPDVVVPAAQRDVNPDPDVEEAGRQLYERRKDPAAQVTDQDAAPVDQHIQLDV
jgi:hypothetical protein